MSRGSTAAIFAPSRPLAALSESPNAPGMRACITPQLSRSRLDHESHRPRSIRHALMRAIGILLALLLGMTGTAAATEAPNQRFVSAGRIEAPSIMIAGHGL